MKIYRRTEPCKGGSIVTEVDEHGGYNQRTVWADGSVTARNITTLAGMGWDSLKEFLANRPGFVLVGR